MGKPQIKFPTILYIYSVIIYIKSLYLFRLVNVGRQRGFVKCLDIKRAQINEDVVKAEIVAKANGQFRIWVEIYAYGNIKL